MAIPDLIDLAGRCYTAVRQLRGRKEYLKKLGIDDPIEQAFEFRDGARLCGWK